MKKGISLIALIITIIVIIILAAITINGVSGILERSRYAKFCADLDAVQESVNQAYGTMVLEEAKKPGEKKNSQQIYQELAGGDEMDYREKTLYQLTDEKILGLKLPTYGTNKWYVDSQTGDVYLLYGFEYNGKVYRSKKDIQGVVEENDYAQFHSVITVDIPTGSIPVIHNGKNWVIADRNSDWYDYRADVRQWANIITVDSDVRSAYLSKPVGTVISDDEFENDVIGMFVYIPRYAYQITSHLHDGGNVVGNIDIVFINKQNQDNTGKVYSEEYPTTTLDGKEPSVAGTEADKMNDFVVHPAFTDNAENGGWEHDLDGIWVAKFEACSSTTELVEDQSTGSVTVEGTGKISTNIGGKYGWTNDKSNSSEYAVFKPNITSWRYVDVATIVQKSKDVKEKHGLTDSTSHQMKNSEWGAAVYLTYSKYGNKNLYNNSYCEGDGVWTPITGMSGTTMEDGTDSRKTAKKYCEDGSIQMTYGGNNVKTFYPYDHTNGYHSSSTDNIYGVYDLAGGSWEYTAAYVDNATHTTYKDLYSNDYEKNVYVTGTTNGSASNYEANANKFGDALYETSKYGASRTDTWNSDISTYPTSGSPSFERGGDFLDGTGAGAFGFYEQQGLGSWIRFSSSSSTIKVT